MYTRGRSWHGVLRPTELCRFLHADIHAFFSARLKNIEETEKAKRQVTEERKERKKVVENDEEHLVATRCKSLCCNRGPSR